MSLHVNRAVKPRESISTAILVLLACTASGFVGAAITRRDALADPDADAVAPPVAVESAVPARSVQPGDAVLVRKSKVFDWDTKGRVLSVSGSTAVVRLQFTTYAGFQSIPVFLFEMEHIDE